MRKERNIKLCGVLLERLIVVLVLIFASYICLTEKYFILNALGDCRLLNKKCEFVNKC